MNRNTNDTLVLVKLIAPASLTPLHQLLKTHAIDHQSLTPTTVTAGTFTLTIDGVETAAIAYNATAAQIQQALQLVSTRTMIVSGGPMNTTAVDIKFHGEGDVPSIAVDDTLLTGTIAQADEQEGLSLPKGVDDTSIEITNLAAVTALTYQHLFGKDTFTLPAATTKSFNARGALEQIMISGEAAEEIELLIYYDRP